MTSASNTRTKRSTVIAVLVTWLLALSAGWVNACLLQDRGTHLHGGSNHPSLAAESPSVFAGHRGAVPAHDENAGTSMSPCLKVCADASQSLIRTLTVFDLTDSGLAPPMVPTWAPHTPAAPTPRATSDVGLAFSGPPLRIRYSRLAL